MAMFKMESTIIDGIEFKVSQFPAVEAFKLKRQLAKLAAPFLANLIGGADSKSDLLDTKIDPEKLGKACTGILDELSEDDFIDLIKRMLKSTQCTLKPEKKDGKESKGVMIDFQENFEDKLNIVFTGKTFSIYPLLFFVLKVNYPDFFGKVKGIGSKVKTLMSETQD